MEPLSQRRRECQGFAEGAGELPAAPYQVALTQAESPLLHALASAVIVTAVSGGVRLQM